MRETLFVIFGIFSILMALGVVFSKNAVYSAFCLILSFFGLSALYLLWGATFVAIIQILIYAGAIVVLFVFVVMLLDLGKSTTAHSHKLVMTAVAGVSAWLFSLLLLRTLNHASFFSGTPPHHLSTSMRAISKMLFNEYLWPFEVLSLFLLALIVAIYAIARPGKEGNP